MQKRVEREHAFPGIIELFGNEVLQKEKNELIDEAIPSMVKKLDSNDE